MIKNDEWMIREKIKFDISSCLIALREKKTLLLYKDKQCLKNTIYYQNDYVELFFTSIML